MRNSQAQPVSLWKDENGSYNLTNLVADLCGGKRLALTKAISLVENEGEDSIKLLDAIYPKTGTGIRIGITGPPGAGKSTLVDQLVKRFRSQGKTVGVIAVDPTSPFTGGALLGDRVRMNDLVLDEGVFIRSMATRGSLGGLAHRASDVADVMDASGKDVILVETVGVGQSELDIAEATDTVVVVLVPESGDSIQAMKAGLMEIADLFVLNKADREGAGKAILDIKSMLHLRAQREWQPEVVKAIAKNGEGIAEIADQINSHRDFLESHELLLGKRRDRLAKKVHLAVRIRLESEFWQPPNRRYLQEKLDGLGGGVLPNQLADELFRNFNKKSGKPK